MAEKMNSVATLTAVEVDDALFAELKLVPTLKDLSRKDVDAWSGLELMRVTAGNELLPPDKVLRFFWVLLEGEFTISKFDGPHLVHMATHRTGDTFGEVPILMGWTGLTAKVVATHDARLLRINEDSFWTMMASCASTRRLVLETAARRFETYQAITLHREKLISLGTLAAGLMHELNNPGAAARRASAQLRENITRLQHISLRLTRAPLGPDQMACLGELQEQVLNLQQQPHLSALEQSDREEELTEWLESIHVENPWRLAPTLVSAGWSRSDINCAHDSFPDGALSDALNYLEALISSMHQVATIEESIGRVTDLVGAVKKYAYDDKNRQQLVDVRDTLLSTLTILNHKFRQKSLQVERELPSAGTRISCVGAGLTQVWTNLLDNAIDATPENGSISVRLWTENEWVCVGIKDTGVGIPREHWDHIFEPFYTTKEAGVGTGLGLDIAHRIVVGNFHGDIKFTTKPGATEFIVRLPMDQKDDLSGCSIGEAKALG